MSANSDFVVDFPTLGYLVADWIEAHCTIPDGFLKGDPFVLYDWQLWIAVNHYRVKPEAKIGQLAPAFHYRRSQIVAPQKIGKGPWAASVTAAEAIGPVLFDGWSSKGDQYRCIDNGCTCGFEFDYDPGDPKGKPWPTPLIQLLATSEDQVANVYRPLQAMAKSYPLDGLMGVGESFIRLPNGGRVDTVSASATARLGNPITFAIQDETGLYTRQNKLLNVAETMRRGAAGMGGRVIETTNAYNPAEESVAQRTAESSREDIFRFHRLPPATWSYKNKAERRKIHRLVYEGAKHIDLDAIEAEAAELLEKDPTQAERFFGNRIVHGLGSWLAEGLWESSSADGQGSKIVLGFDGSSSDDFTALRAETIDGWAFTPTYGPDSRPTIWDPKEWGGTIPRSEVSAAIAEVFERYDVQRLYCDPPGWQSEIEGWSREHGEDRVLEWATYRSAQMFAALDRFVTDLTTGALTHDACQITAVHVANARRLAKPGDRYMLGKPNQNQKIDAAIAAVIAHEAAADVRALGRPATSSYAYVY